MVIFQMLPIAELFSDVILDTRFWDLDTQIGLKQMDSGECADLDPVESRWKLDGGANVVKANVTYRGMRE